MLVEDDDPRLAHGVEIEVAYDGKGFVGWQRQPNLRSVQGRLERALDELRVLHSGVRGASRTDSGVHAEGQRASFACDRLQSSTRWLRAFFAVLEDDVRVMSASPVTPIFDPRHYGKAKRYYYLLHTGDAESPLWRNRAWHLGPAFARRDRRVRRPIFEDYFDLGRMRDAAELLTGTHDFAAFRAASDPRTDTERTMHDVSICPGYAGNPLLARVDVVGDRFMKNMVRIMVGTLVECGRQRLSIEQIRAALEENKSRASIGPTAPAKGLTLAKVMLDPRAKEKSFAKFASR